MDTNIVSEPRKPRPAPEVLAYFKHRDLDDLFVSRVTLAELRFGISIESSPVKRESLDLWLTGTIEPFFAGRTLEVSEAILLRWRVLMEQGRKRGRTYSQPDLLLAATAIEHDLTLATRNTKDIGEIEGLKLYNPWLPTP